jgi:hypothetical protein
MVYTDVFGLIRLSPSGCRAWAWFDGIAGLFLLFSVEMLVIIRGAGYSMLSYDNHPHRLFGSVRIFWEKLTLAFWDSHALRVRNIGCRHHTRSRNVEN